MRVNLRIGHKKSGKQFVVRLSNSLGDEHVGKRADINFSPKISGRFSTVFAAAIPKPNGLTLQVALQIE
jgi:hypothetical protein